MNNVYTRKHLFNLPVIWTEETLQQAIKELETRVFTAEEYAQYMMILEKNANVIHSEKKRLSEAKQEGIEIGVEKGRLESKKEAITAALLDKSIPDEKIALYNNVPLEIVMQIKTELGLS